MSNPWEDHIAAVQFAQLRIQLARAGALAIVERHNDAHQALVRALGDSQAASATVAKAHLDGAAEALDELLRQYSGAIQELDLYKEGF